MQRGFNRVRGRIGIIAAVVLALAALALYLYSERAVPPEPPPDEQRLAPRVPGNGASDAPEPEAQPPRADPMALNEIGTGDSGERDVNGQSRTEDPAASGAEDAEEAGVSLEHAHRQLREDLAARLGPGQIEMVAEERLPELLVTTINSLDGEPVPLRFRPLDHVPDLPRLQADGDAWRLPEAPDLRYRPYRALFDRFDVTELVELFDRYQPALEKAWRALGEDPAKRFRSRLIEVLNHLAEFEPLDERPRVHRPEVLYEYIDPALESLSWGRKVLVRIGPEHAPAVQRKLAQVARQLTLRSTRGVEEGVEGK